ncbi:MAG: TetR family transcriptional regulator [Gammaproteobacteria bacterium]|jgi:AcrR family transcriptional regulator|nr:TetR family transcriptional regulator [Gammaproteobacteria bacterium]
MSIHEAIRAHIADRERILSVSAILFRENGYERTSVREIAKACGMLPGSLHYRYRSKDDILVDMMRLAIENIISGIVVAISSVLDPLEKMRAALRAHVNVLMSGDAMVYVLLFEWRSLQGAARVQMIAERDRYENYWQTIFDTLKVQGCIRSDVDIDMLRLIGLGAVNWVATWYNEDGKYSLEQIGDAIWQMMTRGVLTKEYDEKAKKL